MPLINFFEGSFIKSSGRIWEKMLWNTLFRSSPCTYFYIIYSPNISNAYDEGKTKIIYIIVPQSASNDTVPAFQPNTTLAVVSIGPHVFHTMLDIAADTENNTSIYHRYLKKLHCELCDFDQWQKKPKNCWSDNKRNINIIMDISRITRSEMKFSSTMKKKNSLSINYLLLRAKWNKISFRAVSEGRGPLKM